MSDGDVPGLSDLRALPASTLLETIRHPAAIVSAQGLVVSVNAPFTALLGCGSEDLGGQGLLAVLDLRSSAQTADLYAMARECLHLPYHAMRATNRGFTATLGLELDDALPPQTADPLDLGRVLLHLTSNSFYAVRQKAVGAGSSGFVPTATVRSKALPDRVELRVWDDGTGIEPALAKRVLEPFFTTEPAGDGTGPGLSLSHGVVTGLHGGTLAVASPCAEPAATGGAPRSDSSGVAPGLSPPVPPPTSGPRLPGGHVRGRPASSRSRELPLSLRGRRRRGRPPPARRRSPTRSG